MKGLKDLKDSEKLDLLLADMHGMKTAMQGMKTEIRGMKSDIHNINNRTRHASQRCASRRGVLFYGENSGL